MGESGGQGLRGKHCGIPATLKDEIRRRVMGGVHQVLKRVGKRAFQNPSMTFKISFRDKVVGNSEPTRFVLDDDMDMDNLALVEGGQELLNPFLMVYLVS
ncbi:hypothetical protein PIB30_077946 [Stylosanthes scabra]|uniref:Uncharacterized protein n=1 Tax=Stylosanthes scabra TaxID=79078 RepID=A0ABU6YSI3_9FABA|nr:hypothetical protein [Stylosanthes scabra]